MPRTFEELHHFLNALPSPNHEARAAAKARTLARANSRARTASPACV